MTAHPVAQRSPSQPNGSSRRSLAIWLTVAMFVIAAGLYWYGHGENLSADQLRVRAQSERRLGRLAEAETLARRAFDIDPQSVDAAMLAAECASAQSAWARALDHLGRIATSDVRTLIIVRLREADILHHQLFQLAKAERAYRGALELDADNTDANTGLAQLLSLCGRKREAIPLALRLIRRDVETDFLLLLARSDMYVDDFALLTRARQADPDDPNPLVGLAWHALQNDQFEQAETLLRTSLSLDSLNIPARILLGRVLLAANKPADFAKWARALPPSAIDVAELWSIRGQMAEAVGDGRGAIRCYWEALRLAPEIKSATLRLVHCLAAAADTRGIDALRDRVQTLQALEDMQNRVVLVSDHGRAELLGPMARAYEAAGRLWEAYGWCEFAIRIGASTPQLAIDRERLRKVVQNEPLKLAVDSANVAKTIDLSEYPIPELLAKSSVSANESLNELETCPTFRDDAQATGLIFQYFNGVHGSPTRRMFEFSGGGVAVLDFDLDAFPDLFFTQGRLWPLRSSNTRDGDRLFRNRAGVAFDDITGPAGIVEDGFGQGVTIGDYDADGFPDVYVANIGRNQLWRNQGDGTFHDVTDSASLNAEDWTTSTVMVDLTGDGLPDIYDVNYAGDDDVFDRVCRHPDGSPKLCSPTDFHGQPDRFWRNLGDGRFQDATREVLGEVPLGTGLGVAVLDADGQGRLSLFVANDSTPCFFFQPESKSENEFRFRERAVEAGLAFNGAGKATGCMGVAVGDVDDNGWMDLLITNFYAEPNTLFINTAPGFFEDQTRQMGLEAPSLNMLGFGTQFLDADLDGRLELFVSNGHVDDLSRLKRQNRMPAQLFRLDRHGRFVELPNGRLGPYFEREWLGRAVARLDWNRDGRDDLAIGHLYDPVALLTNSTGAVGRHLSLRLFGIQSNRDAIGTIVQARFGTRTITRQLTAGDGYQCSNERRLTFGAGQAGQIDELIVRWPSGLVQRFVDVAVPAELWLREGAEPIVECDVDVLSRSAATE